MDTVRHGLSLVELLVAISILVATLGVIASSQRDVQFAQSAARLVAGARRASIVSGTRIAVFPPGCGQTTTQFSLTAATPAAVAAPPRGLLFTPDGLPRTCDGGGVGNTTILLEHRGRQAAVIVSSLGRVRWELR